MVGRHGCQGGQSTSLDNVWIFSRYASLAPPLSWSISPFIDAACFLSSSEPRLSIFACGHTTMTRQGTGSLLKLPGLLHQPGLSRALSIMRLDQHDIRALTIETSPSAHSTWRGFSSQVHENCEAAAHVENKHFQSISVMLSFQEHTAATRGRTRPG